MTQTVSKDLVLASASITRKIMLEHAGVSVDCVPAYIDEAALKESLIADAVPPRDIADCLAEAKAAHVGLQYPEQLVLGADQILVQDGNLFSKAVDRTSAIETLKQLSGKSHQLMSAAVVFHQGRPIWRALTTATLKVRPYSDEFINDYLDQLGDVAFSSVGCYQLEGLGAQLFEKTEGDYFTILGLPLLPLLDFLRARGVIRA